MPSPAQTQLLEQKLVKIRVPQAEITAILRNFDKLAGGIIGGVLAPEQLQAVAQKLVDDPKFRAEFIKDPKGAIGKFGGDWDR